MKCGAASKKQVQKKHSVVKENSVSCTRHVCSCEHCGVSKPLLMAIGKTAFLSGL